MLSYLCLLLIAVQHCGPKVMPFVVSFKWLTTAPEIFWQLIHLLLISCTWQLYSKKKKKKVFHATECEKGTKKTKMSTCFALSWYSKGALRDFDWQLSFSTQFFRLRLMFPPRYVCVIWHVFPDIVWGLWCKLAVFFSFFLICVRYRGRPVFACELLFCCLWCGDTIACCRSARRESFFFVFSLVFFLGGTKKQ